jgi:hypothetical protein
MSIPKFESHSTRSSNPHGETPHEESGYNLPDEEVERNALEKEQKGKEAYVPIEEVADEDVEENIYEQAEEAVKQQIKDWETQAEGDEFGYIAMMSEVFRKLNNKEKDRFLEDSLIFMPLHSKIVNEENFSDEEKDKLLRDKFTKIFGHQISTYDAETNTTSMSLHKNKYIKVSKKTAPADAYHPAYVNKGGRPFAVDPADIDTMGKLGKEIAVKKEKKPIFKLPFRKKNR